MKVKIYLGELKPTQVQKYRVLYKLRFTENPVALESFNFNIMENGFPNYTFTKSYTSGFEDEDNIAVRSTYIRTAEATYDNFVAYNSDPNLVYEMVEGVGYVDILIYIETEPDVLWDLDLVENTTDITFSVQMANYYVTEYVNNFFELDLFNDETINLTSKLSDIEKLSNVFTDFSNTFTVPATDNNNDLFKHYYDIDIYNTFNANIRVLGYIEIDTYPLRYGKIQLEKVEVKSHRPSSYKITFYGGLIQISDLFGDDLLSELDYKENDLGELVKTWNSLSQFDYEYNSTNFINTINLPSFLDGNVITPLIAFTNRDWNYGSNDAIDIATTTGAIKDTELRQAIRVMRLIEAIETKYNISFTRNFFGKAVINNLFIWLNGIDETPLGEKTQINFVNSLVNSGSTSGPDIIITDFIQLDLINDTIDILIPKIGTTMRDFADVEFWVRPLLYDFSNPIVEFKVSCVDLVTGSELAQSDLRQGADTTGDTSLFLKFKQRAEDYRVKLKFYVQLSTTSTFKIKTFINMFITPSSTGPAYSDRILVTDPNTQTIIVNRGIASNLPKMKVIDFFQGLMKMFKLVIRPESSNIFYVNTLDGYYADGNVLDITRYIDNEVVTIERPLIYKDITFKYTKTNNVLGKKFRQTYDPTNDEIGYGDLKSTYRAIETKEELSVELPFENMLFERMTVQQPSLLAGNDTNITIGQSISISDDGTSFSPNNSKAILFFNNGIANNTQYPFKVNFASTTATVAYNYLIGNVNDVILEQVTDSINWGAEIDPWFKTIIGNSLYLNYWSNWINTIYSLKQRKFTFKSFLPPRYIEELSLNDRLIINDHRYKINDYTANLTTGETKFTLFTDIYNPYVELEPSFAFANRVTQFSIGPVIRDFSVANLRGSFFLYGTFNTYSGLTASKVVKIGSNGLTDLSFDGTLLGPNVSPSNGNRIYKYDDDKLLVAGSFSSYNGVAGSNVRRLNPNGSIDTTFTPGAFSSSSYVNKVIVQPDNKILLGGQFTTYNGTASKNIVRLNPDGSRDASLILASGFNGTFVSDVILGTNSIYVTGDFTTYKGLTATNIVKMSLTGSYDTAFVMGTFSPATGRYVMLETYNDNDSIYVAGDFTRYKGVTASRITKIASNGFIDNSFVTGSGFNGPIDFVRYTEDMRLFIAGSFSNYNGVTQSNAIILNNDGSISQTFPQTGLSNYFNVGNDVYAIDNLRRLVKLTTELTLNVFKTDIEMNAGTKYYEFYISSNTNWTVEKVNLGWGVDWVDILTPQGNGSTTIQFLINEKASQSVPDVYLTRKLAIKVKSGSIEKWVNIKQTGL